MPRAQRLTIGLLVMAVIGAAGCATTGKAKVAADKVSIAQVQRIGVFTWHGQPSYRQNTGGGIPGAAYSIFQKIHSAASGERTATIRSIRESGVYEALEQQLIQRLSTQLTKEIEILNKENYAYTGSGDDRRVDALASARSQGFDALLEITVWPSLDEYAESMSVMSAVSYEATLSIRLTLTRLADAKLLWNTSYKTWKKTRDSAPGFKTDLVPAAVDQAMKLYASGK